MNNIYTWDNDTEVVKNNQVVPDDETDLDDIDFEADVDDGNEDVQDSKEDTLDESDLVDEVIQDPSQDYDISDDDIVVVMEDGSYVVIPYSVFSTLLQDEDFSEKLDEGFSDITSFQSITESLLG